MRLILEIWRHTYLCHDSLLLCSQRHYFHIACITALHYSHMYKTFMGHLGLLGFQDPFDLQNFIARNLNWNIRLSPNASFIIIYTYSVTIWNVFKALNYISCITFPKCVWNAFWFRVWCVSLQCWFRSKSVSLLACGLFNWGWPGFGLAAIEIRSVDNA